MTWTAIFFAGLVCANVAVCCVGGRRLKGAAVAVSAVWAVTFVYAVATGDYANWRFMFAVDVMAAAWVLTPPCNVARVVIGCLYIAQIVFHGVYGLYEVRGLEGPRDSYLSGLYVLGAVQLAALIAGAFNDWSRKRRHRSGVAGVGAVSLAPAFARDEQPQ